MRGLRLGSEPRGRRSLHTRERLPLLRRSYSSTFFLRRNTMIPRNRIASTAQTIRTIELSMTFSFPDKNISALLALIFSPVLDAVHHRYQFPHDLDRHRTHRHHKKRW